MTADAVPAATSALSRDECVELLASQAVGRLAVGVPGDAPTVVPVNYAMDGEVIIFRTDPGSKLDALRKHPVSFQVDQIDPLHRTGWSVLVKGFAYEGSPQTADPEPWDEGAKEHWVRIFPILVTGRRITLSQLPLDPRGYL